MAVTGTSSGIQQETSEEFGAGDVVSVLLPLPLAGAYDYRVPEDWEFRAVYPGHFVNVPLGKRHLVGVVMGAGQGGVDTARLKDIVSVVDVPAMTQDLRQLIDWIAAYTLSAPGAVLRMAMSAPGIFDTPKPRTGYRLSGPPPERMTEARSRVMDVLIDGPPRSKSDLATAASVGVGVVSGLVSAGTIEPVELPEPEWPKPDSETPGPELSGDQAEASTALISAVAQSKFQAVLLDGVTGAGKTEVYFEAIAETLRAGKQALVLVPEIALTLQWLKRFEARFGVPPAEWHSDLRSSQRRRTWRAISQGEVPVVVGARSGLFLPFPELGLIVVDEEHETSFKQEEGVIYHARDMAVVRAMQADIPVVLASATPSLETLANIDAGRYQELRLSERHGGASMPRISAVDMRKHSPPSGKWLSQPLLVELQKNLEAGEQSMLFLNRRGYAPLTLCRSCGHRLECPHCTAWLVEHRRAGRLMCHHCGFASTLPESCPECESEANFAACGPGVERLAEEVVALFPEARMAVMASDTISSPSAAAELVRQMTEHEIDILIGTQIVAKGHHFPGLTLVGVIDADLGLNGGDLRAAERTWQVLSQVAGRAGRAEKPGRVLLQTYLPEHPVMKTLAAADRDGFVSQEKAARREHGMPPYARLAGIIVSGENEREVATTAQKLGRSAPRSNDVTVLGPAPAPLNILRGRFRYRLLLRARRSVDVQSTLRTWLGASSHSNHVRVQVDIDPISFL
jgi:primosomal protein N' (replication factor Y) (superfamily II helicase)